MRIYVDEDFFHEVVLLFVGFWLSNGDDDDDDGGAKSLIKLFADLVWKLTMAELVVKQQKLIKSADEHFMVVNLP